MKKILKKVQVIYFCIAKINWSLFFKLYDKNAEVILWYYPFYRKKMLLQSVERDFAFIDAFIKLNIPFRIYFGKKIGQFYNKTIFYSNTKYYDQNGFSNYTSTLVHISKSLEEQNNKVYPTSHESLFWENKILMHEYFKKLNINEPKTFFIKSIQDANNVPLQFPYLLKEPHSSSSMGLYKIESLKHLEEIITQNNLFLKNEQLIVQELLNMRKDLRVIVTGNEINLHYWRINQSKDWKPTATGYGSNVDFVTFPEQWKEHILETFKKLNLTSAGFDITWQNDDMNTEPIYLEVSPFYQPNPSVDISSLDCPYGAYKKQLKFKNSWDKRFVDVVFELQFEVVKHFMKTKL